MTRSQQMQTKDLEQKVENILKIALLATRKQITISFGAVAMVSIISISGCECIGGGECNNDISECCEETYCFDMLDDSYREYLCVDTNKFRPEKIGAHCVEGLESNCCYCEKADLLYY